MLLVECSIRHVSDGEHTGLGNCCIQVGTMLDEFASEDRLSFVDRNKQWRAAT